jgi:predicted nucleic acid-binding protein
MIVIDANVLVYLYMEGEYTSAAEALFKEESDWVAPRLWRSEFLSALAQALRQKRISYHHAAATIKQAESFMERREFDVSSNLVLHLIKTSSCSAYDCEYVGLAESFNIPLVTADAHILKNFPTITIPLKTYLR